MITATQIRMARAVLKWSQADLAKAAGLSLEAVMIAEGIGPRVVPMVTTVSIVRAFRAAGIEVSLSGITSVAPGDSSPSGRR